ncbi:hypothetical protein [Pedobacter sp. KBW01]|uniref:hypothetical protein n=1 Tax=Pedobacter sp. KBW01 TaxID=2153364 RepID=UPI000F59B88A|nr:hypothetical protein [Pedobacter sp. KBW01]
MMQLKNSQKFTQLTVNQKVMQKKIKIIGSMFPEKFTFEELQHRTAKRSAMHQMIYLINNEIEGKKRRASDRKTCLPTLAPSAGLEPATL